MNLSALWLAYQSARERARVENTPDARVAYFESEHALATVLDATGAVLWTFEPGQESITVAYHTGHRVRVKRGVYVPAVAKQGIDNAGGMG